MAFGLFPLLAFWEMGVSSVFTKNNAQPRSIKQLVKKHWNP